METYKRICIRNWFVEAENGDRQDLLCGTEYITSAEREGMVTVFKQFWVKAPIEIFAGEEQFT